MTTVSAVDRSDEKLARIDENIFTVLHEIHMPLMDLPRRMTVVRLIDARPVIFDANALDDDEISTFEADGRPACLTGGQHSNA
jgi:hypothetical protein